MSKVSAKTKIKQKRGQGDGKDYKPFIKAREFNSKGTCSNYIDWKTGRQMEFLSQTELQIYMQLRWDDDNIDIKEQFPLDLDRLNSIIYRVNADLQAANKDPLKVRFDKNHWLTTDFVVQKKNGNVEAISVKYDKSKLSTKEIETVWIEKKYWNSLGHRFLLMDRSDINHILVKNLRLVMEYYEESKVHDISSYIKHLIATKRLDVDIESSLIDMRLVMQLLLEECDNE